MFDGAQYKLYIFGGSLYWYEIYDNIEIEYGFKVYVWKAGETFLCDINGWCAAAAFLIAALSIYYFISPLDGRLN